MPLKSLFNENFASKFFFLNVLNSKKRVSHLLAEDSKLLKKTRLSADCLLSVLYYHALCILAHTLSLQVITRR